MKILKVKSRNYNGKQYYKYRINLPEESLKKSGLKEGDDLEIAANKGKLKLFKR